MAFTPQESKRISDSYDIGVIQYTLSITPKWRWLRRMHLRQDLGSMSDLMMGECNGK